MSQHGKLPNGAVSAADEASERTPLLPPGPTTTDAAHEALPNGNGKILNGNIANVRDNGDASDIQNGPDDGHTTANQTITAVRGTLVVIALACVIFLQGWWLPPCN